MSDIILENSTDDTLDRRGFLKCMAWAGTGVLFSVGGGILSSRLLGGTAAYYVASVRALIRAKITQVRCTLTSEGVRSERQLDALMIAVCNGRYFGSGMHVAPMAKPDDGRFEVVTMSAENKLAFLMNSRSIYDGSHLKNPHTTHFSCEKIELDLLDEEARSLFLLDVDGEALGTLPVSIEIVPKAVTLRA